MIKKNLELIDVDGSKIPFSIEIGHPSPSGTHWLCPVSFSGLHGLQDKEIYGMDSVQSLCLALGFTKKLIESLTKNGAKIHEVNSDEEWPYETILKI